MYRIYINDGIAVETSVVNANSQFPVFFANKEDGVIIVRYTELYPALFL